jgi:hypothetical protein
MRDEINNIFGRVNVLSYLFNCHHFSLSYSFERISIKFGVQVIV